MKPILFSVLAFIALGFAWRIWAPGGAAPTARAVSCPPELPGGLDARRLVVLGFSGAPVDSGLLVFLKDLEELLVSAEYQVLSAASQAAAMPPGCIAWKLDLVVGAGGPGSQASLEIRRFGEQVENLLEGSIESTSDEDAILPGLRQAIASQLAILPAAGRSASLRDPRAPGFKERLRAMRHDVEGRRGEAARILQRAVARDPGDAALHFRLGRVLASWASEMKAASARPSFRGAPAARRLDGEARRMFAEAQRHLDQSLALEGRAAQPLFARGQMFAALGRRTRAETDLVSALEIWPAYGEATVELARLRLARGDVGGLEARLDNALWLLDRREVGQRADLLLLLGRSRLEMGQLRAATAALTEALTVVPIERRAFRLEALALLAEAQGKLGEAEAAVASWRSHDALAAAGSDPAASASLSDSPIPLAE